MKALQLQAVGKLELVDVPVPSIRDEQLLVRTRASTICTSDLNDVRANPFNLRLPVVIGHEGAGVVAAVGKRVGGFRVGDPVAAHPVHPCGECRNCKAGIGHLCLSMGHFGINLPGTFAEYFVVRQDRARVIPQDMPFQLAALAEPVCVCLEALDQAKLRRGGTLLIIGDGPFGILMARLARTMGLSKIVIAGRHDFRLAFAEGAVQINEKKIPDAASALMAETQGAGFDAVILAVGTAQAARLGLSLLRPKGRLVVFSAIQGDTPLDLMRVHINEMEIVGACNDAGKLDTAVRDLADRSLRLDQLVTHALPITAFREAFALAQSAREEAMKVAIVFSEEP